MSWIVASLLNNRERIRSTADINSDEFNDLLLIEKAIETLLSEKRISKEELELLGVTDNDGYEKNNGLSKYERHTLSKKRAQICDRIAYYLGGYFTDDGYLDHMQKKHKLTQSQVDILRKYINGRNKHRIIRKPITGNTNE